LGTRYFRPCPSFRGRGQGAARRISPHRYCRLTDVIRGSDHGSD
jgi:hypothetical protein